MQCRCSWLALCAAAFLLVWCAAASGQPNLKPAAVLSQMDIDGDNLPDTAPDTDGEGLPDSWEHGPFDDSGQPLEGPSIVTGLPLDRLVRFSAPTAIGPGTPPTFVFARQAVATSATSADTDADGLSDFVEVFGLKFIEDNGNGKLDFLYTDSNGNGHWDPGEQIDPRSEWLDINGDGMPSVGEYPLPNVDAAMNRQNDFDGFMFTDPTLTDTDGDGTSDGNDLDPLINPATFGVSYATGFTRPGVSPSDWDLDNDGLGNGSDFGDDLIQAVDFPSDLSNLLELFRPDRLQANPPSIPESLIEDLLGADWDGSGLYRITDQRDFSLDINQIRSKVGDTSFHSLFYVGSKPLFADNLGAGLVPSSLPYADRQIGMGGQLLLLPTQRTDLLPDPRVWTVLYAWRMPGFDIDGDGFIGPPSNDFADDDVHPFVIGSAVSKLDGRIDAPAMCGNVGAAAGMATVLLSAAAGLGGAWRRRRRGLSPFRVRLRNGDCPPPA